MTERAAATKTAWAPFPVKVIEPENLLGHFDRIYNSIARGALELFEGNGSASGHDFEDRFKAESELLHPVKVNLTEADTALMVQAEVPGFTAKDQEIRMEPGCLTISGKREASEEQKKGKTICEGHRLNEILRAVDLPAEVDTENATATLRNGMLELQVPKNFKAKGTHIEVKSTQIHCQTPFEQPIVKGEDHEDRFRIATRCSRRTRLGT